MWERGLNEWNERGMKAYAGLSLGVADPEVGAVVIGAGGGGCHCCC